MASGSAEQVRYLEESTPGTVASGNPKCWRVTKASIDQTIQSVTSKETRADMQISDNVITQGTVGGSPEIEMSLLTHDDFMEAVLADQFVPVGTGGKVTVVDAVFSASAHTITSAGAHLPVLAKGQFFQIKSSTTPGANGIYQANYTATHTTGLITVIPAVKDCIDVASGSVVLSSSRLKNGADAVRTFSIERALSDVSQYFMATGCVITGHKASFKLGLVTGSFDIMGRQMSRAGASAFPGIATAVAATTTPVLSTVHDTSVVLDGAALGTSCMESFELTISRGAYERRCLGAGIGVGDIIPGTFDIKASLTIYFGSESSAAVWEKMAADTPITIGMSCLDSNGDGYAYVIERGKISSCKVDSGGINTDTIMSLEVVATVGATSLAMLAIDRLGSTV